MSDKEVKDRFKWETIYSHNLLQKVDTAKICAVILVELFLLIFHSKGGGHHPDQITQRAYLVIVVKSPAYQTDCTAPKMHSDG